MTTHSDNPNDPSPEQIKAACEAIRARWSDAERRRRLCWVSRPVHATEVPVAALRDAAAV